MSGFTTTIASQPPGIELLARYVDYSQNPYASLCASLSLLFYEIDTLTPDEISLVLRDLSKLVDGQSPSKRSGFVRCK